MSEKKEKKAKAKTKKATAPKNASADNESSKLRSRLTYILLYIAAFAFVVYALVTLIGIHSQIAERKAELDEIKGQITVQEIKNDEMAKLYNYTDEEFSNYVEQIARDDLDFVKPGERVFVNVAGD